MKKIASLLVLSVLAIPSVWADDWDINRNFVSIGIADQGWTIDDEYTGIKGLIDARYTLNRKMGEVQQAQDCCPPPPPAERLIGILDADFQFGDSSTNLEYMTLAATPLAYQRNTALEAKRFMGIRDTLEFGQFLYSFDDPLGIDYYMEATVARAGRSWAYKLTEKSPWSLTLGLKASLGWAWASSVEEAYKDVSNPFFGGYTMLALSHATWGQLYTDDRVVAGFTLGSPATGKALSRESRIRFGYFKKFKPGWTIDLFFEKRSFNFSDPELPDLYTKAKRVGGLVGYQF